MKLKNALRISFLMLTLIPVLIVLFLLYKSGYELSKESYTNNLIQSINIQSDYITQTLENNMISDHRFAQQNIKANTVKTDLYSALQTFLSNSEDKITASMILDEENLPIYTTGEERLIDEVIKQLPQYSNITKQTVTEFKLDDTTYSLGIVTPVYDSQDTYLGSMVSIYDKSYLFKIISSYYNIADSTTYIVRNQGEVINFRGSSNETLDANIESYLTGMTFENKGIIENPNVTGYYKNISNSPWLLAGFLDDQIVRDFTNQFIWVYIVLLIIILIIDVILSLYFSNKVVQPINALVYVMSEYQSNLHQQNIPYQDDKGYFETRYLHKKFIELMKTISLVQHNFEGVYQLYQSADMGDINIDIDVIKQTISSNKDAFKDLIKEVDDGKDECIVEKFTKCFDDPDQQKLQTLFEHMRDEHLSVPKEIDLYTRHLQRKWFHSMVVPMYENDKLSRLFIQLRDISNFKIQEIETTEQARRDALTGLYNRQGFVDIIKTYIEAEEIDAKHAILFIDMDYFKLVNDNFGHQEGDRVLCKVSEFLLDIVKTQGVVARFGGDEFVVFLPRTKDDTLQDVESEIHEKLVFPYENKDINFSVTASIGVSTFDEHSKTEIETILKQADSRMYEAKRELKQSKK